MINSTKNPLIFLFCLITFGFAHAQDFDRPNGFGGQVLFIDHDSFSDDVEDGDKTITTGFEFSYSRHFNKFISVRIPFKGGIMSTGSEAFAKNRSFAGLDVTVQASYFGNESRVAPFVYTGFGGVKEESQDIFTQIPIGGGLNFKIGKWGFFQVKAEYRADLNNELNRTNMQYGLGLMAVVGPTKTTEELEKLLSDTDGDGVDDDVDRCPDIPGRKQFGGCLDSDNDGIGDADDSCPDEIGLKALNGCPDSDADGVADVVDNCPTLPGTADGCPDADMDGVADRVDKCPDLAGSAEFGGCIEDPTEEMTEEVVLESVDEEDGMAEDLANEMGDDNDLTAKGFMPAAAAAAAVDSDGDGVEDRYDACPNSKGTSYNNGCPVVTPATTYNDYSSSYNNTTAVPASATALMNAATESVRFRTLSDDLTGNSHAVLGDVVDLMMANPSYRLKVSGHTDDRGEDSVNQRLSEKRARACIRFLRDHGVAEMQMSYIGYGARIPVSDNDTEFGRKQNRRVDFELYIVN